MLDVYDRTDEKNGNGRTVLLSSGRKIQNNNQKHNEDIREELGIKFINTVIKNE
jgi:hypothetical protein